MKDNTEETYVKWQHLTVVEKMLEITRIKEKELVGKYHVLKDELADYTDPRNASEEAVNSFTSKSLL